ncbi:FAD:protein FMN transferase [Tabrizicola sp.]|uniref:FAD:protein FMN transferase n=1 Tax=Tabrizicola sp. TaxID=2005166 RepID=UPI0025D415C0|nr:FAD:protein FMN transferase [Tabrizicola sp.]
MLTRRRFIAISAALAPSMTLAPMTLARTPDLHIETGTALGAKITLRLQHPDAARLAAQAMDEIRRLEKIFSLYLPDSALARLNRDGQLLAPPFELLECLAIAGAVHFASDGHFDPTVQPLWRVEAQARLTGTLLSDEDRAAARSLIDWAAVNYTPDAITLRPGMALTLNGIAQGYIADRVAEFLAGHGLTHALIDTGELFALPEGSWPVELASGGSVPLRNRALATSAPLGMTFGGDGQTSHILDPLTGRPVNIRWRLISISAPSAALADAVSTAGCVARDLEDLAALCDRISGARIEAAVPA